VTKKCISKKWAEFRFSVIGNLLASPPPFGKLKEELKLLADRKWQHPISGEVRTFHWQTIEEWYYKAKNDLESPVEILKKQVRSDRGKSRTLTDEVKQIILQRYEEYKFWSYQLHRDNLVIDLKNKNISPIPSYSTVRRYLQSIGRFKMKQSRSNSRPGYKVALARKEQFEIRSYENQYVNGLWHLDFHHCSRPIITSQGEIVYPLCLAIIDDHSRLLCHIQWYLTESAEDLIHGFSQALQKRGIPRSLMTDNGAAMTSEEFTTGLLKLGIVHETTLPYSPYQNGKQEVIWGQLEGRLMAMLRNQKVVTLKQLNDLTIAWAEIEYNKSNHSEINSTPINRFLNHSDVARDTPSFEKLALAFRRDVERQLRRSDGTIHLEGKRFEVPFQYKHFKEIRVQYAKWDLSFVHIVDYADKPLAQIFPVDKEKNASGRRKKIPNQSEVLSESSKNSESDDLPPLLKHIENEYKKTGLPPAYLPKNQ
jgi:putative transposase